MCIVRWNAPVTQGSLSVVTFNDGAAIRQQYSSASGCRVTSDASGPADVSKRADPPFRTFNRFRPAYGARFFCMRVVVLIIPCSQGAALACRDAPVAGCNSAPVVIAATATAAAADPMCCDVA
eukprot:COSAG01_NODE_4783_length_4747_cov_3.078959_2_plen_123_part_00